MKLKDLFRGKKKPKRRTAKKKPSRVSNPKNKKIKMEAVKKTVKKKTSKSIRKSKPKIIRKQAEKRKVNEKPVEISRNECPECGSSNVVIGKMTGNTICQECGAIFAGLTPDAERKIEEVKKQG